MSAESTSTQDRVTKTRYEPAEIAVIAALRNLPVDLTRGEIVALGLELRSSSTIRNKRSRMGVEDDQPLAAHGAELDALITIEQSLESRLQAVKAAAGIKRRIIAAAIAPD